VNVQAITNTILAALLAVLTLVACVAGLASSAWAECAWVLWQREVIDKRELGWTPRESFKTVRECRQRESKADTGYNRETQKLEPIPDGHRICLPDTVDPRGPKAR
jgi:hypothetical protein